MQLLIAVRPGSQPAVARAARSSRRRSSQVIRRWSDDLGDLLTLAVGEEKAQRLLRKYADALPEAYKEDFPATDAVRDLTRLEQLPTDDGLAFDLYTPGRAR